MGEKKVSTRRFVYEMMDFFTNVLKSNFEVSCYVSNKEVTNKSDLNFAKRKICRIIKNDLTKTNNRLFLAISITDTKLWSRVKSRELLQELAKDIKEKFWQSEVLDLIEAYEGETKIKIVSINNHELFFDYIAVLFILPDNSSIEFIISTDSLTKIIERDDDGEIVNYNKKLSTNIILFEEQRKK